MLSGRLFKMKKNKKGPPLALAEIYNIMDQISISVDIIYLLLSVFIFHNFENLTATYIEYLLQENI